MIDYQRLFHTGVRVADIDAAMGELAESLDVEFCPVIRRDQSLWTPEDGLRTIDLRFTYSRQGPQHVELLQGPPGTPWHAGDRPGVHHQGVWTDDVVAETERLVDSGWRVALAQVAPEDGYGSFTYLEPPSGMLVELVTAAALPAFETWWATGEFPAR